MGIFVDSADTDEVKRAMELRFIHGVTTNPILIVRSGKEACQAIAELSEISHGPMVNQSLVGTGPSRENGTGSSLVFTTSGSPPRSLSQPPLSLRRPSESLE